MRNLIFGQFAKSLVYLSLKEVMQTRKFVPVLRTNMEHVDLPKAVVPLADTETANMQCRE